MPRDPGGKFRRQDSGSGYQMLLQRRAASRREAVVIALPPAATPASHFPPALRVPEYRRFLGGNSLHFLARFIDIATIAWLVIQYTDSPFMVALVAVVRLAPMALIGPVAGIAADRFSRLSVMRAARGAIAAAYLVMALLLATDVIALWHMYLLIFTSGAAWTVDMASRRSMTPDLVEARLLANAIALEVLTMTLALMAGPILAGAILPHTATGGVYAGLAILVMVSVLVNNGIDANVEKQSPVHAPVGLLLRDGFAFVRANPPVAGALLVAACSEGFAFSFIPLIPVFAQDVLGAGSGGLGLLMSAEGFGAIAISLAMAIFSARAATFGRLMLVGSAASMGLGFALAASPWYGLTFPLLVALGATGSLFFMMQSNLVFTLTPRESRGRLVGIQMLVIGMFPLGTLLAGVMASVLSPQAAVAIMSAIGLALLTVVAIAFPVIWRSNPQDG